MVSQDRTSDVIDVARGFAMGVPFKYARPSNPTSDPARILSHELAVRDWLLEQKVIKRKLDAENVFTNELIDDIDSFDVAEVIAMAKAYMAK